MTLHFLLDTVPALYQTTAFSTRQIPYRTAVFVVIRQHLSDDYRNVTIRGGYFFFFCLFYFYFKEGNYLIAFLPFNLMQP